MLWCTGIKFCFSSSILIGRYSILLNTFMISHFSTKTMHTLLVFNVVFLPGVYFYKDNILGNCTILPLKKSSFGAKLNRPLTNHTGDFMLDMQNPLELFYLDKGYTFVGTVIIFVQFFFYHDVSPICENTVIPTTYEFICCFIMNC